MARRRCLHRDCTRIIPKGSYCREHSPSYRTRGAWGAISTWVLQRDMHKCRCPGCSQCLGQPCGTYATTVDHITPTSQGGTDEASNLCAMCRPCNTLKGGL